MRYRRDLAGLGASAILMAAGLLLLPKPGFTGVPHLFALFWLAITAGTMLGFGASAWRAVKLQRIQRRWRRRKPAPPAVTKAQREAISAALARERERRLD